MEDNTFRRFVGTPLRRQFVAITPEINGPGTHVHILLKGKDREQFGDTAQMVVQGRFELVRDIAIQILQEQGWKVEASNEDVRAYE